MTGETMKLRPVNDMILVRLIEPKQRTVRGFIIPENVSMRDTIRTAYGKVLGIGEGVVSPKGNRLPIECQPGDIVLYKRNMGTAAAGADGNQYIFLREADILAVCE